MNAQFKKGVVEMCILKLVGQTDMYGPILRRLTVAGYFDTYKEKNVAGPDRKYYKVTSEGEQYLEELLKEYKDFTSRVERIIGGQHEKE